MVSIGRLELADPWDVSAFSGDARVESVADDPRRTAAQETKGMGDWCRFGERSETQTHVDKQDHFRD